MPTATEEVVLAQAPAARQASSIRPFTYHATDAELNDLRRRIEATRWPEKETVADTSQGVPLAPLQDLARYWENKLPYFGPKNFSIPAAVTVFPGEVYQPSRRWAERGYSKLSYFHEVDKGGHFAAWEEPLLFASEMRAAFKSLR